ncbi:MAG: hypothetical protein ACM3OB_02690 [Acidobacteriota bacterium]
MRRVAFLSCLALLVTAGPAAADLVNGSFDAGVAGWTVGATAGWVPMDSRFRLSGSVLAYNDAAAAGQTVTVLSQCVPLTVATSQMVPYGISVLIPLGQARSGAVLVGLAFSGSSDCSGGALVTQQLSRAGDWIPVAYAAGYALAVSHSVRLVIQLKKTEAGGGFFAYFDQAWVSMMPFGIGGDVPCLSSEYYLCLNRGRFLVEALYTLPGATDPVHGVAVMRSDDSGEYWFFDRSNLELFVKVLDGCRVNDHFWVFAAGLTNVGVDIGVVDTAPGGAGRSYINPVGHPFAAVQDTSAFSCP